MYPSVALKSGAMLVFCFELRQDGRGLTGPGAQAQSCSDGTDETYLQILRRER